MGASGWGRSSGLSLNLALAELGALALACGGIEFILFPREALASYPSLVLFPIIGLVYVAAGLLAWWRRPINRLGPVMVAAGYLLYASGLQDIENKGLIAIGLIFESVAFAAVLFLLHAFPSGRLDGKLSNWAMIAILVQVTVLQMPYYLFAPPGRLDVLSISDRPDPVNAGLVVQATVGMIVMVLNVAVLVPRWRQADPDHRRILGPLYVFGSLVLLVVPLATVIYPHIPVSTNLVVGGQLVAIGVVPVFFVLATFLGGFSRTGALEELAVALSGQAGAREALGPTLAAMLGDASAQVVYWLSHRGAYVDSNGREVPLALHDPRRAVMPVERGGQRVGAIVYDATLLSGLGIVSSAAQMIGLVLDPEQLIADLRARELDLLSSRTRLVDAGDNDRIEFARNLHDGLQARLVVLGIDAQQIASKPDDARFVQQAAEKLRASVDAAASDVRQLARTMMPLTLTGGGLASATEDLIDRMPVPTKLTMDFSSGEIGSPIERTAYFVIAEALSNAVDYNHATEVELSVRQIDGRLEIEVVDNGEHPFQEHLGPRLRSVADRIDASSGTMQIDSYRGRNELRVSLPS